jgi:hypothetical protein
MTTQTTLSFVCSNRPRPSVQHGRTWGYKTGAALWGRDVYHARGDENRTLCGRVANDWLTLDDGDLTKEKALADDNFCHQCAKRLP